jgi:hypothetical protein
VPDTAGGITPRGTADRRGRARRDERPGVEGTLKLGDWLISKGKITIEQLSRGLQDQTFFGGRLGHSLMKLGYVDEDTLGAFLADVSGTPYAPASRLENIPPEVIAAVPSQLAGQYRIVPMSIESRRLHLAMRDPLDLIALDEIAFLTGLAIRPYVATEFRIHAALERYYQVALGTRAIPVSGGAPSGPAPERRPSPPPPQQPKGNLGLDGYPLDADPDDIDQPFTTARSTRPSAMQGPTEPLPASMEEWRMAREEIPDSLPEPVRPAAAPRASQAPQDAQRTLHVVSPAAAPAPAPPPGVATPAPTIEALSARLRAAETREEVFDALLDFTAPRFQRCALFIAQPNRVLGWNGRGEGLSTIRIRNVTVGFDRPSLFVFFRKGGDYYYGPVPDLPANARFYLDLGCPPPARVLLLPLTIKDRPAVLLYADQSSDAHPPPDVPLLRRAMRKAALALEILILKNKIMMV